MMRAPIRRSFLWTLLAVNLVILPALLFLRFQTERQGRVRLLPVVGKVAEFRLTDQNGKTVTAETLKGSPWVANFMFTRCPGQCPAMNAKMSALQGRLPPGIRFVSFTVDPAHDTPAVLSEYARRFYPEKDRWFFLTGPKESTDKVLSNFHLNNSDDPGLHTFRFVFIDKNGAIRGYYDSLNDQAVDQLVQDAWYLASGKGEEH